MMIKPVTAPDIIKRKGNGVRIVMLTAYDTPSAMIADSAGVDIILVGDSLGNAVLGYKTTLPVTLRDMIYHTRAVVRGTQRPLIVGDMPFMSYHLGPRQAVKSAGQLVKAGGAGAVKLEGGGRWQCAAVRAIVSREIPVMGHVGLTPQSVHRFGGYRVQGRSIDAAELLLEQALALEKAGCFALVIEGVPGDVAGLITQSVRIPTIGIGAGINCDGQVLVFHDLVGLSGDPKPKFVKQYIDGKTLFTDAIRCFISEVRDGVFPTYDHTYKNIEIQVPPIRQEGSES